MTTQNSGKHKKVNYTDQTVYQGNGGETHQDANQGYETLTTQQGAPVSDNQNSLKQGARGATLLEDFRFREKMFHFDHERIPERVVHARGYGAHGYFETYDAIPELTKADIFQRKGEKTPLFAGVLRSHVVYWFYKMSIEDARFPSDPLKILLHLNEC